MPQSLYICLPRGLWVIKCGWVCLWICHYSPWRKATKWELSLGSKRGWERSGGEENWEASPKDEMPGDKQVKVRKGVFTLPLTEESQWLECLLDIFPRGFLVIKLWCWCVTSDLRKRPCWQITQEDKVMSGQTWVGGRDNKFPLDGGCVHQEPLVIFTVKTGHVIGCSWQHWEILVF